MAHELRGLARQSHERLTNILIGGGLGGIGLLAFVGFLLWRGKRRGPPKLPGDERRRRPTKKRRR